jgi:hypothetical protein
LSSVADVGSPPGKCPLLGRRIVAASVRLGNGLGRVVADSDEVARAIRDDVARDYEMISPGFGASLA